MADAVSENNAEAERAKIARLVESIKDLAAAVEDDVTREQWEDGASALDDMGTEIAALLPLLEKRIP